jgi:predicted transcriptional regulator
MSETRVIHGELQSEVMATLWRLEAATVEQVRSALPPRYRGAYTTIQTVLNRLADRQLLTRHRVGNAFEYRPAISEADHISELIAQRLATASTDARQTALARLLGELTGDELRELRRRAGRASVE